MYLFENLALWLLLAFLLGLLLGLLRRAEGEKR